MNARLGVAVALLLICPARTLAQIPSNRLDLSSLSRVTVSTQRASIPVPMPAVRPHEFQTSPARLCADSEAMGRTDAERKPMHKGWFWGSFGAGLAGNILGVIVAPAVAANVKSQPKVIPPNVDQGCYSAGFSSKARHDHTVTAILGSLAGFGTWFALYFVAS